MKLSFRLEGFKVNYPRATGIELGFVVSLLDLVGRGLDFDDNEVSLDE